ncbi:MAG: hypothetical protein ACE5IA_09190, partial [Dehalococcoidia bacterium]
MSRFLFALISAVLLSPLPGLLWSPAAAGDSAATALARSPLFTSGTTPTGQGSAIMRALSLEQLAGSSARIVIGRARSFQSFGPSPDHPTYTDVTFSVEEELKATSRKKEVVIRLAGGQIGDTRFNIGGTPEFTVGEKAVVFLGKLSPDTYGVVGRKQGRFAIGSDGRVERVSLVLDEFKRRIHEAVQGTLQSTRDPLETPGVHYLASSSLEL